jgi:hypothetical protein
VLVTNHACASIAETMMVLWSVFKFQAHPAIPWCLGWVFPRHNPAQDNKYLLKWLSRTAEAVKCKFMLGNSLVWHLSGSQAHHWSTPILRPQPQFCLPWKPHRLMCMRMPGRGRRERAIWSSPNLGACVSYI